MRLFEIIKRFLPSYRAQKKTINRIKELESEINSLKNQIRDANDKNEFLFFCQNALPGESIEETKRRVFLNIPKADGKLRYIQLGSNYILQKLKKICDENEIEFFLSGGTVIGAIRHNGFIPWDDDIDVFIMQDQFDKLKAAIKYDDEISIKRYYNYFGSRNEGTTFIKAKFKDSELFYVDIFILDRVDVKMNTVDEEWEKYDQLCNEFHNELGDYLNSKGFIFRNRPIAIPEFEEDAENMIRKYKNRMSFSNSGEFVCESIEFSNLFVRIEGMLPYNEYFPLLINEALFEGEHYNLSKNYKMKLYNQYGDIWKLPSTISWTHPMEFIDFSDNEISILKRLSLI
ncbi:MAG: LicD family protein [Clostridia bacterium]|nr:LicD family protein [Clostridia bacterium]